MLIGTDFIKKWGYFGNKKKMLPKNEMLIKEEKKGK